MAAEDMVPVFPDGVVLFIYRMQRLDIYYGVLIILAWAFLLFIMRKCVRQIVAFCGGVSAVHQSASVGQAAAGESANAVPRSIHNERPLSRETVLLRVTSTGNLNSGSTYELRQGGHLLFGRDSKKANVAIPEDTKGVSAVHCEIKEKDGVLVLIDRGSSYGTFFANGTKLEPNVPYKIRSDVRFYLAAKENEFQIHVVK